MLKYINALSLNEVEQIENFVFNNRSLWTPRSSNPVFYTLGACSYLDISTEKIEEDGSKTTNIYYDNSYSSEDGQFNYDLYIREKKIMNPLLKDNLGNIYKKICDILENEIGSKVEIYDELAFPGFHILTYNPDCEYANNCMHLDDHAIYHMDNLSKKFKNVNKDKFLSFTLAVKMPKNGSGLYIWPFKGWENLSLEEALKEYADIQERKSRLYNPNRIDYEKEFNPEIVKYAPGKIIFYIGNLLHEMMPFIGPSFENDYRITMQAHGIYCDNRWIIYF